MIEALTSLSAFDKVAGTAFSETAPVQRAALPVQAPAPAGAEFGDVMAQFAAQARDALRLGEATSIAGIQGHATAQQVVEAVMSAEQSLQTVVAIRDKVVAAYLELSRMPI
ncbi:flagellar hook-basal body complex protein FliE [Methylorubrum suomiense]|uniref:Flagellar hook-basal body complex protein FliE n=1 Tax=Methylorubrum suomiense TaxID=144191 RepID=A0ABQ4UVL2_9HYPH|nr:MULTISPECIES: flagellar hook-basal body complex protein FliE [Methylobacteriaceae]GJE76336.1 Flagellar hook-basal body complex protein FliE [Methylorubrum suomiense]